jgi:hypothetical protein
MMTQEEIAAHKARFQKMGLPLKKPKADAPAPAPVSPVKDLSYEYHKLGQLISKLHSNPANFLEHSRYQDSMRRYEIPNNKLSYLALDAKEKVRGTKVESSTIGESGADYSIQATPDGIVIEVSTKKNWAREYVYRDVFETVGDILSMNNEHLKTHIKEIYKGAMNKK